jgi:hypothetical protein
MKTEKEIAEHIKIEVDGQRAVMEDEFARRLQQAISDLDTRFAKQLETQPALSIATTRPTMIVQQSRSFAKEPPRYAGTEVGQAGAAWIELMDAHIRLVRECDPQISEKSCIDVVLSFLDGAARRFATQAEDVASWADLKRQLEERFGVRQSAYHLLHELRETRQGKMTVIQYADLFEQRLGYLIAIGSIDSTVTVSYFIDGLADGLRSAVLRSFLSMSEDPMARYTTMKPRLAVRELTKLAMRVDDMHSFMASKPTTSARVAMVQPLEAHAAVASSKTSIKPDISSGQRWRQDRPRYTREEMIEHLAKKYGVSRTLVDERLRANVCAACGSNIHIARDCTGAVTTAATAASSTQSSNSKAH